VEIQIETPSIYCPLHIRAKISKFKREDQKNLKKKPSQDLNGGAQNSTYSHSLILFKRKNNKPIRKILFPPSPCFICFLLLLFSYSIFFSFFNPHIKSLSFFAITTKSSKEKKVEKEKKNLKRKSITNQEDGTSFPPNKIPQHLKDLKILNQILRSETSSWTLLFC